MVFILIGISSFFIQLLSLVRRIAETLISLQQNGCVDYIGWSLTFACKDVKSELSDLSAVAHYMNRDLRSWQNNVNIARCNYYALNYYSAKQLLYLRYALKLQCNLSDLNQEDTKSTRLLNSLSKTHLLSLLSCTSKNVSIDLVNRLMSLKDGQEITDISHIASTEVADSSLCPVDGESCNSSVNDVDEPKIFEGSKHRLFICLMEDYDYSRLVAEKATEQFDDEDEAVDWCEDNKDKPEYNPKDQSSVIDEQQLLQPKDSSKQVLSSSVNENTTANPGQYLFEEEVNEHLDIDE